MAGCGKGFGNDILGVPDQAHVGNGEHSQVGADQQGLGVGIGNGTDAGGAVHFFQVTFKLGAERGSFDIVDLALKTFLGIVKSHAAALGSQVRVVVSAEENIILAVFTGDSPEETTHT